MRPTWHIQIDMYKNYISRETGARRVAGVTPNVTSTQVAAMNTVNRDHPSDMHPLIMITQVDNPLGRLQLRFVITLYGLVCNL